MQGGKQRAANVIFMGADYDNFEVKNMYKALNVAKPDIVLLQVRPDLVLDKFKYLEDYAQAVSGESKYVD